MLLQDFSSPGLLAQVRLFSSRHERSLVRFVGFYFTHIHFLIIIKPISTNLHTKHP